MSATSSNHMQKLTPDGGIVKVVLDSPDSAADLLGDLHLSSASSTTSTLSSSSKIGQSIKWVKGANAKLHYSVCTAPFRPLVDPSPKHPHANKCDHSHSHSHHKHGQGCKHHHHDDKATTTALAAERTKSSNATSRDPSQPKPQQPPTGPIFASPSGVQFQFNPSARRLLADTRRDDGPDKVFELRIGRQFSFAALETAVKSMNVGETAKFLISPEYSTGFIQLESHLRRHRATLDAQRLGLPPPPTCCMGLASDADAHADLYASADLPLELQVTLYDVQMPDEYVPESWEMSPLEKVNKVPEIKSLAGDQFQRGQVKEARETYARALEYLESVQLDLTRRQREDAGHVPGTLVPPAVNRVEKVSPEWVDETLLALRLNIALCSLKLHEYDKCVAQCTAVLEGHPECTKARFRRGLAHVRRGRDLELAQKDLEACVTLGKGGIAKEDPAWTAAWRELDIKWKKAKEKERDMWKGMFAA